MKVIILAGGRGTRLAQKSARDIPKVLVRIAGKPIVRHQVDLLQKQGFSDIRLALGFRAEQIIDYFNGLYEYLIEPEPLGTGGAVKFASRDLQEPFMVLNGDILSDFDFKDFARQAEKKKNYLAVAFHQQNTDFGLINIDAKGRITQFLEKPVVPTNGFVSVGFYILQPDIVKNIKEPSFSLEYHVFPKLAQENLLYSYQHNGFWTDLGTEERLALAKKILKGLLPNTLS